ncbi:SGNH hydrolase [Pleurotus eryngii]|uniref:SGNH hydrolase n=1 Tax=Pleurotus eryngii TaxID=5323 RepID=A0A9P5ZWH2_PLEER|nr:SGNH hydrolase [Pleurotus eryngii]
MPVMEISPSSCHVFLLLATLAVGVVSGLTIQSDDARIHYHGRWDDSPGTWWAGSGFKLHVKNATTMKIQLGPTTTTPFAAVGVSVDYEPFFTVNASAGWNDIPLPAAPTFKRSDKSVIRVNVEGWQNNRINLQTIVFNRGATLHPYKPSKLSFQFIGDSLSAGQYLPLGVDQAWPFLLGEQFKAEHTINAQPGATLTDIPSYGNVHGVSFQFFKTEDTGYVWTADHNYTTPWDFRRDRPSPTHVVIHIGANDVSQGVTPDQFVQEYLGFLKRLRTIYRTQPIFVFTPWGWPSADGNVWYYYDGKYEEIVRKRIALGDSRIFLVNTTGWVTFDDVFADNQHPNVPGHAKIANLFSEWLENWGLRPERQWATPA